MDVSTAVDQLLLDVQDTAEQRKRPWSPVASLTRAAEHVVMDPEGAPAGAGSLLAIRTERAGMLADVWTSSAMSIAPACTLFDSGDEMTLTTSVPIMSSTDQPTAGPQGGEKQEAHSDAWRVGSQAIRLDSSSYVNASGQLLRTEGSDIIAAFLRAATAHEVSAQVGQAMQANGTPAADNDAAWAHFDGSRFTPRVLVCPPSAAPAYALLRWDTLGVQVVPSSSVTQAMLVDPSASVVYLGSMTASAVEVDVLGREIGVGHFGVAGVDATGVAVIA